MALAMIPVNVGTPCALHFGFFFEKSPPRMRAFRVCAIFSIVFLLLLAFSLFVFASVHYHNWWSLFVWPICLLAFLTPAVCYNYVNAADELGWSVAAVLFLGSYAVPMLAWYNPQPTGGMHWGAVLLFYGVLTCLCWAYVLWLKIFVYYK
jgi:hypothetical protein